MNSREEILAELRRSRQAIARDLGAVRAECDVRARAKAAFQKRPILWLGSAMAVGWLIAGKKRKPSPGRKKPEGKGRDLSARFARPTSIVGIVMGLLKLLIPLLKPVLTAYAARRLSELGERIGR